MSRALRLSLAVGLAGGACYGPTYSDCAIECAAQGCPSGLTCVEGYCRTANAGPPSCVDAPPGDDDGDQVTDDVDNCLGLANADQADEDQDDLGDACDPCPPFPGVDNNDDDRDGVGNGCDPNPTVNGDRMLLFEGFKNGAPGDATLAGNWLFLDGQARLSDSTPGGPPSDILWDLMVTGGESVLARLEISNLAGPSGSAGVIGQVASPSGFACQAGFDAASAQRLMIEDLNQGLLVATQASGITAEAFLIDQKRTAMEYRCSAKVAPTRAMHTITTTPATLAGFGLRASDAAVQYDWVMVIGSP